MKIALISDIHGNHDAFKKVLEDLDASPIDKMVCLGDCIGYGPQPEEVIAEVRSREIATIIGNHEMAVCDRAHLDWFNPMARSSLQKSLAILSDASLAFIHDLPTSLVTSGVRCVHGFPPDSTRTYLFQKSVYDLKKAFESMQERICFVGHTHNLEMVEFDGRQVERRPLSEGITILQPEHHYIISVGSVGQPRDGNNKAKYVIWDDETAQIDVKFIPYDIASTVAKIKAAGLPEVHAHRLW